MRSALHLVVAALVIAAILAGPAAAAPPIWFVEGIPLESGLRTFLLAEAGSAYERELGWFGRPVEGPITIAWIADPGEFGRRTGMEPSMVGGVARAESNEIVLNATSFASRPDRIRGVLHHELCHLFFAAATSGAEVEAPRWLNEGIAMWRSGEWDLGLEQRRRHADVLRDAGAAGTLFPLEELDSGFPGGAFFGVAYAQSISFVEWLLAHGGEDSLRAYLARLDADEDPSPAFSAVYGLTLEDAERKWRRGIVGGPLGRLPSGTALFGAFTTLFGFGLMIRYAARRLRARRREREAEETSDPDGLGGF
jgi:hypothetical protein